MALVGGGGTGNVSGSNPAGTGTSLNYIGDYAFAYSATFAGATSSIEVLGFATGSEMLVGKFNLNSCIQIDTANITGTFFRISFNGEQVGIAFSGNGANDSPSNAVIDMIVPPYTNVVVDAWADGTAGSSLGNVQFTGRVYA